MLEAEIRRYDDNIARGSRFHNDDQLRRIAQLRRWLGDRVRTCRFQRSLSAVQQVIADGVIKARFDDNEACAFRTLKRGTLVGQRAPRLPLHVELAEGAAGVRVRQIRRRAARAQWDQLRTDGGPRQRQGEAPVVPEAQRAEGVPPRCGMLKTV